MLGGEEDQGELHGAEGREVDEVREVQGVHPRIGQASLRGEGVEASLLRRTVGGAGLPGLREAQGGPVRGAFTGAIGM